MLQVKSTFSRVDDVGEINTLFVGGVGENVVSSIGQSVVIRIELPLVRATSVIDLSFSESGVTADRFFTRTFKWRSSNPVWSQDQPLLIANLDQVIGSVDQYEPIFIEITYTRAGSDDTGDLSVQAVDVVFNVDVQIVQDAWESSAFSGFFDSSVDPQYYVWATSVLDKLYAEGIVPIYIERNSDYLNYWRAASLLMSMIVNHARVIESFDSDRQLLFQFLLQRNLFLCGDESLEQLQWLAQNIHNQFSQRATVRAYSFDEDGRAGEMLRAICYGDCDEFTYSLLSAQYLGLVVGHSSPLYKGLGGKSPLNKLFEKSDSITDIDLYPISNSDYIEVIQQGELGIFRIFNIPNTGELEIGSEGVTTNVDPSRSYELYFEVNQSTLAYTIQADVVTFDSDGIETSTQNIVSGANEGRSFMSPFQVNTIDAWYPIRLIVFPHDHVTISDPNFSTPTIGYGDHKRFAQSSCKIAPIIRIINATGAAAEQNETKIRKIRFSLCYDEASYGYIHSAEAVFALIKNNSSLYSFSDISRIFREYFVPYGAGLFLKSLNPTDSEIRYWEDRDDSIWVDSSGEGWIW